MDNHTSILVTVVEDYKDFAQLLKTAIKATNDILTEDVIKYYLEPENTKIITDLLPLHCRGKIVEVQKIFETKIIN